MKINSKGYIEPEVGEIISTHDEVKLKVVRSGNCRKCHFKNITCYHIPCGSETRDDGLDIKFKDVKDE